MSNSPSAATAASPVVPLLATNDLSSNPGFADLNAVLTSTPSKATIDLNVFELRKAAAEALSKPGKIVKPEEVRSVLSAPITDIELPPGIKEAVLVVIPPNVSMPLKQGVLGDLGVLHLSGAAGCSLHGDSGKGYIVPKFVDAEMKKGMTVPRGVPLSITAKNEEVRVVLFSQIAGSIADAKP